MVPSLLALVLLQIVFGLATSTLNSNGKKNIRRYMFNCDEHSYHDSIPRESANMSFTKCLSWIDRLLFYSFLMVLLTSLNSSLYKLVLFRCFSYFQHNTAL